MEESKIKKRKITIIISSILLVMILIVSATYAYFTAQASSNVQTITTGNLGLAFDDNTAIINAENIKPIYDSEITDKAVLKTFSITNLGSDKTYADISLTDIEMLDSTNNLEDNALLDLEFKWALYEGDTKLANGNFRNVLDNELLLINNLELLSGDQNKKTYNLYIWISESDLDQSEMMNKTFKTKITVDGHQSKGAELLSKVIKDNNRNEDGSFNTVTDFSVPSKTDEGLNITQDEDGDTYYFRGKVEDNYVKIGNLIESDDTGYYVSNNKVKYKTQAVSKIVFTPTENGTVSFNWRVSSSTSDKLNISLNEESLVTDQSGEVSGTVTKDIVSGVEYTLSFNYTKLSNGSDYNDKAYISNLSITSIDNPEWITEGEYGFVEGKKNDFLWRIVRINGDGTIRLVAEYPIDATFFNEQYKNEKYAGYTYDNSSPNKQDGTNSDIKNNLENWYTSNMLKYDSLIANTRYCNDTSSTLSEDGTTLYFGSFNKIYTNIQPSYICPNTDKTYGGEYDLKIGLISIDEFIYSGFIGGNSSGYFLFNTYPQLIGSPADAFENIPRLFTIHPRGGASLQNVNKKEYVMPVINLRADTLYSKGNGEKANPYEVSL